MRIAESQIDQWVSEALNDALSQSDVRATLCDCLSDLFPNQYAYICDVFGDDSSGYVVYSCNGDTWKAPYRIGSSNGNRTCSIDDDSAVQVMPHTTYDPVGDANAQAVERAERAARAKLSGSIRLVESAATIDRIVLREARADYPIKLIAPGKGASAFYPAEVLKRDGPKVFGAGTHVYLNHPTSAEEAARPEGDVKNLAGVTTTKAEYQEDGAKGPGLYARMKVFADHGQMVEDKAAHVGMSIRANGIAESGKTKDGLPVLKELTHAESVDIVTRAGAGGMILTESARQARSDHAITERELTALIDSAIAQALA